MKANREKTKRFKDLLILKSSTINSSPWMVVGIIAILIIAMIVRYNPVKEAIVGIVAWNKTVEVNSYESYNTFVEHYPLSKHIDEAKVKQEDALWLSAKKENSLVQINNYVSRYPEGRYINEANFLRDSLTWEVFCTENSISAYKRYLSLFPKGQYASQAHRKIEELNVKNLQLDEDYLGEYGENVIVSQVNNGIYLKYGLDFETSYEMKDDDYSDGTSNYNKSIFSESFGVGGGGGGIHYYSFGRDDYGNYLLELCAYRDHMKSIYYKRNRTSSKNDFVDYSFEGDLEISIPGFLSLITKRIVMESETYIFQDAGDEVSIELSRFKDKYNIPSTNGINVSYNASKANWDVFSGTNQNDEIVYCKYYYSQKDEGYHSFLLKYPKSKKNIVDSRVSTIVMSFGED